MRIACRVLAVATLLCIGMTAQTEPAAKPAAAGDVAELLVTQVARVVAHTAHAGVRHKHGARGGGEHVVDRLRRGVREIDDDVPLFEAGDQFA